MTIVDKKSKAEDVQAIIEIAWHMGRVRIDSTIHASERSGQRAIGTVDLRDVIIYGKREEEQDRWKKDRGYWTYALRNKNVDGRDIRIIFDVEAFPEVVIVTVMHVYS